MNVMKSLQARASADADILLHRIQLSGLPAVLIGYRSLIDLNATLHYLQQLSQQASAEQLPIDVFLSNLGEIIQNPQEEDLLSSMLSGQVIAWFETVERFVNVTPISKALSRSIEPPATENVIRGSISAFVEDLDTNIGLIRRHSASKKLHVRNFLMGAEQQKRLVLLYKEDCIDQALSDAIIRKLEQQSLCEVQQLQQLGVILGFNKWSVINRFNTSELPQEAEFALTSGKAVLLLDRMPFAIILPSLMWDMFAVQNDRNFPPIFMYLIRFLRVIGVLTNIIMPGLYVALVSVNPDVLRIELALSIAKSRIDVPYPSLVETLLLLIILELILEASIRLPKSIGPTLTMVGGIILGQAVVSAKLVSNLLIIILAATTISSSTVVGFQNSLSVRLFKYVLLILSAIYGVLGLLSGLVIVCGLIASVSTFGIPYLHVSKPKGESNG